MNYIVIRFILLFQKLSVHNNDTRLLGHRNTGSSYDIDFNIEVIGNIYENPELLKGVDE
ncbi:MAG: hypothetical protein GX896_08430 [Clostridiales bacterium]|nr:hypothetical protein [Clostridiales bacterium]